MKKNEKELEEQVTEEAVSEEAVEEVVLTKEEELELKVKDLEDQLLRNRAELVNFKKRVNDEKIRDRKYASMGVLGNLIQPLEMLDKVVATETDDDTLKNWLMGFKMINSQLFSVLESEGVKVIDSKGKMFDPSLHQSVSTEYDETKEEGIILEELSKGYMFKERILKPSMVKVNKKEEKEGNENE